MQWLPGSFQTEGTLLDDSYSTALITVHGDPTYFHFGYPVLYVFNQVTFQQDIIPDVRAICGEIRIYVCRDDDYDNPIVLATGVPPYDVPYMSLTADFESDDPTERSATLTFLSESELDYGLHMFELVYDFVDYPETVEYAALEFYVQVDPCQVEYFSAPGDLSVSYTVGEA